MKCGGLCFFGILAGPSFVILVPKMVLNFIVGFPAETVNVGEAGVLSFSQDSAVLTLWYC